MNILAITPFVPYPLSEGAKVSQYAVLDYLRKDNKVTLALVANSKEDIENVVKLKKLWPEIDIEIIEFQNSNNLNSYLKDKLRSTLRIIEKVKSKKKNGSTPNIHSELENPLFINSPTFKSRNFINNLNKIIQKKKYDIVQVDMLDMLDIVHVLPKEIKKVFVHHEIRFVRIESGLLNNTRGAFENYAVKRTKLLEINYLNEYDAVFVFSDIDKAKLNLETNIKTKVYTAPFPYLDENYVAVDKNNQEITKLVFIGGEIHPPNSDAVQWYIEDIAPLVAEFSGIELHIIGNWSKATIKRYNDNKNILFPGYVDDIISYCKNSIMIVPVRIGSGIRTKILYAMAQGIPIISASVGCEGIFLENQKSIIIADTPKEFANSIKKLLNEPKLRYSLALEAQEIAKNFYSQTATVNLRNRLFEKIVSN